MILRRIRAVLANGWKAGWLMVFQKVQRKCVPTMATCRRLVTGSGSPLSGAENAKMQANSWKRVGGSRA